MKIVAFGYKKGTGKDTAAQLLITALKTECRGVKIVQSSFAGLLKVISYQLYGWAGLRPGDYYEDHRDLKEVTLPEIGLSPRSIWIGVGNKLREVYPNTWLHHPLARSEHDFKIITDLRFWNEAVAVRDEGGILIRMDRNVPRGNDPAEIELDSWRDWDYVFKNNGSFNYLNSQIVSLAEKVCQKKN